MGVLALKTKLELHSNISALVSDILIVNILFLMVLLQASEKISAVIFLERHLWILKYVYKCLNMCLLKTWER